MCSYIQMLDYKLPELQYIIVASKDAMSRRIMGVEDEVGSVLADLGTEKDVPEGPCVNVWSGAGTALENNQADTNLLGKIAQQVKVTWECRISEGECKQGNCGDRET
jgi:hypothetical protein